MIKFRPKTPVKDLMPEAIKRLDEQGLDYKKIKESESEKTSMINSKAMVITSFSQNEHGYFEIKFRSKQIYRYVQKLLSETFGMRITDIDQTKHIITAETDHLGIALDIIEVLGLDPHFDLSVVTKKK